MISKQLNISSDFSKKLEFGNPSYPRRQSRSAWVGSLGCSAPSVCLSISLSTTWLKNKWPQSVQTWYREWPWDILEMTCFGGWKAKGQVQRSISAFFHINDYYAYVNMHIFIRQKGSRNKWKKHQTHNNNKKTQKTTVKAGELVNSVTTFIYVRTQKNIC